MLLWAIARASAFVALGAYTIVVAWGIMLAGKAFRPAAPQVRFHRFVASLGLVAVVSHVVALLGDHYAKVSWPMLFGVGAGPGTLLGAIALWSIVALPLSFRIRRAKWISQRLWRGFHYLGYAIWPLIVADGLINGTDGASPFAIAAYAGSTAIVAGCAVWRVTGAPGRTAQGPDRSGRGGRPAREAQRSRARA